MMAGNIAGRKWNKEVQGQGRREGRGGRVIITPQNQDTVRCKKIEESNF